MHLESIETKIIGILGFDIESPLHVGIGGEEAKRELIRLKGGRIVIPSSSWKGAFRHLSEQIAKSAGFGGLSGLAIELYKEGDIDTKKEKFGRFVEEFTDALTGKGSDLIEESPEGLERIVEELGLKDELRRFKDRGDRSLAIKMAKEYLMLKCPIGCLYGNKVMAGRLRFSDSIVSGVPRLRPGVGIDRSFGKAKESVLYFIETLTEGDLKLAILADNLREGGEDSRLLASTLEAIEELGLSIGGRKSTGLGRLKLREDSKFYILKTKLDNESGQFVIGNPMKKLRPIGLEGFVKWLRRESGIGSS